MASLLNFAGLISAVFGLMFLFAPNYLTKIANNVNKVLLDLDSMLYKMRIGIGISLCLVSLLTFFMAYYIVHRYR